jgi:hypothetical protein
VEKRELDIEMWADLRNSEIRQIDERNWLTQRALNYMEAGLPLVSVLDAFRCSRATWYRRVQDLRQWQARDRPVN